MKNQFALLWLCITMSFTSWAHDEYMEEIQSYAENLYQSFDIAQKTAVLQPFADTNRLKWNNLPVGMRSRPGISVGNMNVEQRKLLHRILSVSLSSQGYLKTTGIMRMDELLLMLFDSLHLKKEMSDAEYSTIKNLQFSPANYFFAFFGKPGEKTWGYKLEGHHLSLNFTFSGETISVTPFFIGIDPAEFAMGDYAGWRVLGEEEDLGIKLIHLLNPAQQKKATMSGEVPGDIITAAESGKRLIDYWGLPASEMTQKQQQVLQQIVKEFVFNLEYEKAEFEYGKILKAGIEKIYLGWIGPYKEEELHYYVINGPSFLIEFDNRGNHIHTIWREKGNEYGEDVLRQHYLNEKH